MLGKEIAAHLVGHAHVAEHDAEDIFVDLALAHEADRQDAQALLEGLGDAVNLLRARCGAAHVDLMGRASDKPDQAPVEEHRHDLVGIGEMPGTNEAVVDEDRVAELQGVDREVLQNCLGHSRHGAQMPRTEVTLRDHDGVAVKDGRGEIVALPHAFREGRVSQSHAELVRNRDQRIPDHGERNGIDATCHCDASLLMAMMM